MKLFILDTTLRDGAQTSSVSFTMQDKQKIYDILENFGVDFIEAGWPGANEVDTNLFEEIKNKSKTTAFCMTSKTTIKPANDENLKHICKVAKNVTIVGKTSAFHVTDAINTTLEKNLESIASSVEFLVLQKKTVIFDAEHFFDGYKLNAQYSLQCVESAMNAGADFITLCDTNGGTMPNEIFEIVQDVVKKFPKVKFGIHTHNDCECAVANTIAAVKAGCQMVQGTINGLGERCGNANLLSVLPILMLKLGYDCGKINGNIQKITEISKKLSDILNEKHNNHLPFVGSSAFAHKGGLHASAVLKNPKLYEHIKPESVGNQRKILISNQAGRSNVISMLADVGIAKYTEEHLTKITKELKQKNFEGYNFEGADASFYILARKIIDENHAEYYKVVSYKIHVERRYNSHGKLYTLSEAILRVISTNNQEFLEVAEGNGPVDSMYNALRRILIYSYPHIQSLKLNDYKVRIVNSSAGTGAKTLVLIEFANADTGNLFSTVGVSENIIDASFQALNDAVIYYLINTL
jgi:2-isopropylmalate synthase